jgi:transposase-like protein
MCGHRARCDIIVVGCCRIDFPIAELLDDRICLIWLERYLHPAGLKCRHCGRTARRLFRDRGHFPAYRCRVCASDDNLLTGTVFENTRPRPAALILLLRGMANLYVATDEAMVKAKRVTAALSQRVCIRNLSAHASST